MEDDFRLGLRRPSQVEHRVGTIGVPQPDVELGRIGCDRPDAGAIVTLDRSAAMEVEGDLRQHKPNRSKASRQAKVFGGIDRERCDAKIVRGRWLGSDVSACQQPLERPLNDGKFALRKGRLEGMCHGRRGYGDWPRCDGPRVKKKGPRARGPARGVWVGAAATAFAGRPAITPQVRFKTRTSMRFRVSY